MKTIDRITRHAEVSEKALEQYLTRRVKQLGGLCLKFTNNTATGFPDRICMFPGGKMMWVELKSRGEKPRALQLMRIRQLAELGVEVYVCDSRESIDRALDNRKGGAV